MVFQVTNFKFELLVSIINCFSMLFHGTLFEKVYTKPWMACFHHEIFQHVVSWDSFEINIWMLISFMNWCNTLLRTTVCTNFTFESSRIFKITKKFGSGRKNWEIWCRDESLRCVCALRIVAIIHGIFCQDWPWRQEMQLTSVASINSKRQHLKSCHSIFIRTVST